MAEGCFFSRVEKKYLLNTQQYQRLTQCMEPYMQADEYGEHTICNLYLDNEEYDLIRTSISKPVYKEKCRIRSYGVPDKNDRVFMELKKKYEGIVYKRRTSMTLRESKVYLGHGISPLPKDQVLREIDYFIHFYQAYARVYIAYDRIAYAGKKDPDLRMTFDKNIRSRFTDLDLSHGTYGDPLLEEGQYLLEIKAAGAYPVWLARALSETGICPVSFSKYGRVYEKNEAEKRENKEKSTIEKTIIEKNKLKEVI